MLIAVGTQNTGKIHAVKAALTKYERFHLATIEGCTVESGVSDQPCTLEHTILGAKTRALAAYDKLQATMSIGLESGIFPVPGTKSGYMDVCCCAIYDGKTVHLGFSSAFEYPLQLVQKVLQTGCEVSAAAAQIGLHTDKQGDGIVGYLTNGIIKRTDFTEQAIHTAMVHLNHPNLYS
jgi:inosine/xanthosine triphosphatase